MTDNPNVIPIIYNRVVLIICLSHSLTKAQAKTLFDATGGWAIGINALSKGESLDVPQESGQFLEHYISRNIWEKWDPELREFMMLTSVAIPPFLGRMAAQKRSEIIFASLIIPES